MNRLLLKILMSKQGKWQFLFAGIGLWIGMMILLLSVQLFLDVRQIVFGEKSKEDSYYLIINKQVSLMNTFNKNLSGFTKEEVAHIDSQEVFLSVGKFLNNTFTIQADLEMQLGFSTDLFFEAIPDKYIDNVPPEFKWKEGQEFVPVIISSDFLNLYNFGFAMSQGLPQLPPEAVQLVPFNLTISGNGKKQKLSAKVIGFSDRIPSVLVPVDFMKWANDKFGEGTRLPSRLIVEVSDPGDPRIKEFLKENKYQANQEKLRSKKAGTILKVIISLTSGIGVLFIVLSFLLFIINFQLIISRAKREIEMLLNLGYTSGILSRILNVQLGISLLVIVATVFGSLYLVLQKIHQFLSSYGYEPKELISTPLIIIALATIIGMLILNSLVLRSNLTT